MKFSPIFALLATCAPVVAHAQTADTPAVAALPMAPKSAATSDAFVWRFMPPVGSHWTMRMFTRSTSLTSNPAMAGTPSRPMKITSLQHFTADYDVISRDALGATTIRMTMRDMALDSTMEAGGKTIKAPFSSQMNPKAVDGATLTIKKAPDGKVWGVVGMREFQRKLLEATGMDKAMIDKVLDANPMMKNSDMIKSMSGMAGTLPTSPVRVGESWSYKVDLPAPSAIALDISGTRTLKSLDSNIAVVADSASYTGGNSQMKIPGPPDAGDATIDSSHLTGSVTGVSRVQRSSGLPLETTIQQTIKGSLTTQITPIAGKPAQKMTVPMDATISTRMVLEPRV